MNNRKWKEIGMYVMAVFVAKWGFAGCFPLIPVFFTAVYMEEVNRTLLLIFSIFGMALFVPVQAMAKYTMVILLSAVVIKLAEWVDKTCHRWVGAASAGAGVFLITVAGELLQVRNRTIVWMGVLEALLVSGMIVIISPVIHYLLEENILRQRKESVEKSKPEHREKLQSYAKSFNGLSQIFSRMKQYKSSFEPEEMGRMQQEITGKICMSCNQCAICWQEDTSPMYEVFYKLINSLEKCGVAEKEVKHQLEDYCPYSETILEEAAGVFERAKLNLSWYNRLLENRGVIAQQLDAMADIMEDCAKEYIEVSESKGRVVVSVKYRLKEYGMVVKDIHLYERQNGRLSLQVKTYSRWGNCITIKEIAKAVSQGMKRTMVPGKYVRSLVGKEEACLTFEEDTVFHSLHGVARLTKDNAQISGDSFSVLDLEGGDCVLALSDGMGSGISACKESEMVIELIEKFLETGFRKEMAIRMMNSAMVIQDEAGMFSTVDMADIDLYTGKCDFYKIGAATTFIKRQEEVECISSATLPAGIFHQLEIEKTSRQLQDGDFVVLVTDGVLDYLRVPAPEETLREILETIETNNPGQLAKQVLERVLLFTAGKVPDDMTVLAAGIWEK